MLEIALIREAGIVLELISEWGPWSPCSERCKFGKGFKTRRGFCRIKRNINKVKYRSISTLHKLFIEIVVFQFCRIKTFLLQFSRIKISLVLCTDCNYWKSG